MIANGTRVRTAEKLEPRDYTPEGQALRRAGVEGVVISFHNGHGWCFGVRHDDVAGTVGHYDEDELTVLDPIDQSIATLTAMTDDDRNRVFAAFCRECGAPKTRVRAGGLKCCYPDPDWERE